HPARQVIEQHKAHQTRRLVGMCAAAGLDDPEQAAAEITFLLEGAQVSTQNGSIDRTGDRLMAIVEAILQRSSRELLAGPRRHRSKDPAGVPPAQPPPGPHRALTA